MPLQLKPDLFKKMTSAQLVTKMAVQDIKNSVGKDVLYVAAKGVKLDGKAENVFLIADKTAPWETVLKQMGASSVTAGECRVLSGPALKVVFVSATGSTVTEVLKAVTPLLKAQGVQAQDWDVYKRSPEVVKRIVQASHDQAGTGLKLDNAFLTRFVRVSLETTEYGKFAAAFEELASKYKMTGYKKVPVNIWADLINALAKSGYVTSTVPKGKDGFNLLEVEDPSGKKVREATLALAMQGMKSFTDHAATYLDKVVAEVRKAGGTPTWSFWSGDGAKDAARKENPSGVVLEGSVGSWFDSVYDFAPFTDPKVKGISNMALWTSMSELYAQKAAEYYDSFSFRGYVGARASRDQSVFNKIEQPTFIEVLSVKKKVSAPQVEWFVVDCVKNSDGFWEGSGRPSVPFPSRAAAVDEVKKRYGG